MLHLPQELFNPCFAVCKSLWMRARDTQHQWLVSFALGAGPSVLEEPTTSAANPQLSPGPHRNGFHVLPFRTDKLFHHSKIVVIFNSNPVAASVLAIGLLRRRGRRRRRWAWRVPTDGRRVRIHRDRCRHGVAGVMVSWWVGHRKRVRRRVVVRHRGIMGDRLRSWPWVSRMGIRRRNTLVVIQRRRAWIRRAIRVVGRLPPRTEPARVCPASKRTVRMMHPLRRRIPIITGIRSWGVPRISRRRVPGVVVVRRPARVPVVPWDRVPILRAPGRPAVRVSVWRQVRVAWASEPIIVRQRPHRALARAVPRTIAVGSRGSRVPQLVEATMRAHGNPNRLPEISACTTAP
mmetsp:Transcript_47827/g.126676  ORF Transcript_47827/g.126676 Transcript_47827/m.126676 type:complete len:348 (-) Transcript_47827:187-1230(-)